MAATSQRTYRTIDADGHVLEPPDLWERYIDPAFRDRAPRLLTDPDGGERIVVEDAVWADKNGFGGMGGYGLERPAPVWRYVDGRKGGFDPHARIEDMDAEGVDASFSYPTLGLFLSGRIQDPELSAAVARAYNRWLADYCSPYPDRLFGAAMIPMQSVEVAVRELRYARETLGMPAAFVRANPIGGRVLHDPANDPIWAIAQDLDMAVGLHVGGGVPGIGAERFAAYGRGVTHAVSHTAEMMLACAGVIMCGICQRFPSLRVGFLEAGGGWMAGWLDRMDRHVDQQSWNDSGLRLQPSEYFRRQCWISFEPVEGSLPYLIDYLGPDRILWATDYPHGDGFPGAPDLVAGLPGLTDAHRRTILAEGAIRFYNMGKPEELMTKG